jgi:hypothetical protein
VVDVVVCRGFCKKRRAERGFLRGKCGGIVVICMAKHDSKSRLKNRTGFSHKMKFIFQVDSEQPASCEA